jgi:hypothetical protein
MAQMQKRSALVLRLADPANRSLSEAVADAKTALAADAGVGGELIDLLGDEAERNAKGGRALHLLEIISAVGLSSSLMSIKGPLLAHNDSWVRSKSVLLLGREIKSAEWVMRRMLDPDQGVRANAIESVWGVQTEEMRRVFERAARSPNSRIAANGLVGLYLQNEVSSIPRMFEMAKHPESSFRHSARWAMGETRDIRFLPWLTEDYKSGDRDNRGMVLRALARIRNQFSCAEEAARFRLRATDRRARSNGVRSFRLSVSLGDGRTPPDFTRLNFILQHDAEVIYDYDAIAQPNPSRLVVFFAIPRELSDENEYRRAVEDGLSTVLKTKREGDLWWIHRYCTEPTPPQNALAVPVEDPALANHRRAHQFLLAAEPFISRFIQGPGRRDEASADIATGIRHVLELAERASGTRHLFICFDPESRLEGRVLTDVRGAISESRSQLHGFMPGFDCKDREIFRELCESTGGTFQCADVSAISELILDTYEQLLNLYDITYQSTRDDLTVRLVSPHGCGEFRYA